MLASTQTIAPKPAALPPAAQPTLPTTGSAGGPSFAQFLNEQPARPTPPAHADAAAPESSAHEPAPAPTMANAATRRPATPTQAKPPGQAPNRTPDATAADKPEPQPVSKDENDGCGNVAVASTDAAEEKPETAGLDEFTQLIGLSTPTTPTVIEAQAATTLSASSVQPTQTDDADMQPAAVSTSLAVSGEPAVPQGAAHAGRANGASKDDAEEDFTSPARTDVAASPRLVTERRPAAAPVREAAPRAQAAEAAIAAPDKASPRSTDTLQAAAASNANSTPHATATPDASLPSFAALLAQALPTTGAMPDAAPVSAGGQVRAALHSSAFAPELAASVSLLAVDGVQQAELQLNPADMGPVAVQIVVDGAQAQVSFHAVHAETRQALEQSLPDLAAALQGQGLTLSGGGVFQQAPRDADHGQDRSDASGTARTSRGGTDRIGATAGSAAAPVRRSVGLLDTFA